MATFSRVLPLGAAANDLRGKILEEYPALQGHVQFCHDRRTKSFRMVVLGRYQMEEEVSEGVAKMFHGFDAQPYVEASPVANGTPAWYLATRAKYARRGGR